MAINFNGKAHRIEDIDLPRIGATIGVGEDPIHALIEVETLGSGFDSQGRPKLLFEPHKFYAHLRRDPAKLAEAVKQGLAYPRWGMQKYPKESYTRMAKAMLIDERAALMSGSWGMGQIMGENYKMAGYESVEDMVQAFADDEDHQLEAMINFIKSAGIDDDLRHIQEKSERGEKVTAADWVPIVRVYNGAGFAKNNYHNRAAQAYNKWLRIKDTPYAAGASMKELAEQEQAAHEAASSIHPPETPDAGEAAPPEEPSKGITTSPTKDSTDTEGTPPPAPAVEVQPSKPSMRSQMVALGTVVTGILTTLGIEVKDAARASLSFARDNTGLAIKLLFVLAMVGLGVWIYQKAVERAHQRTLKVIDAAASQDKNNVRLV